MTPENKLKQLKFKQYTVNSWTNDDYEIAFIVTLNQYVLCRKTGFKVICRTGSLADIVKYLEGI